MVWWLVQFEFSPLHYAASKGNVQLVKTLVERYEAKVNSVNKVGIFMPRIVFSF